MRIGRRPLFFLGIAIVFLVMIVPTPHQFWWLNVAMAGLALFWFVLLAAEELSSARGSEEDRGVMGARRVDPDDAATPPPGSTFPGGRP
jgi:hypothetical protein